MARLTGAQERIRHVDSVLTPSIVKLIRESAGTIEGKSWATALDVSLQTICRVRLYRFFHERKAQNTDTTDRR